VVDPAGRVGVCTHRSDKATPSVGADTHPATSLNQPTALALACDYGSCEWRSQFYRLTSTQESELIESETNWLRQRQSRSKATIERLDTPNST
jgi:hypothetical protein